MRWKKKIINIYILIFYAVHFFIGAHFLVENKNNKLIFIDIDDFNLLLKERKEKNARSLSNRKKFT